VNSRSFRKAHIFSSLVGTAESKTKFPWNNLRVSSAPRQDDGANYVLHFLDGFIPTRDTLRYTTIANIRLESVFIVKIARNVVDSRCLRSPTSQQGHVPVVGVVRVITKIMTMAVRRQRSRAGGNGQLVVLVWRMLAEFPRWRGQRLQWDTIRVNGQVQCYGRRRRERVRKCPIGRLWGVPRVVVGRRTWIRIVAVVISTSLGFVGLQKLYQTEY
jgi:hypothetical protein